MLKGKVKKGGSKHSWFENGKCEMKKCRERRKNEEEEEDDDDEGNEKKKYENDFSTSMAADGGGRIRTFYTCDNRKILPSKIYSFL